MDAYRFVEKKDRWREGYRLFEETLLFLYRSSSPGTKMRRHTETLDALFCHPQQAAVVLGASMKRIPTILSLDATAINLQSFGQAYRGKNFKRLRLFLAKKSFKRAAHLVTWSRWAKDSLVDDYSIPERKITVIAPGPDLTLWNVTPLERAHCKDDRVPRALFVGGDFRRKGGELLIKCAASLQDELSVDIVTSDAVASPQGVHNVRIHHGIRAGSPELLALYRKADFFVFPTLADAFGLVILEAMAMRLPVVTTPVGAIPELVVDGETGLLIPPNSADALTEAIRELSNNPVRRRAMGDAARQRVERYFDGARNYGELIALIKTIADARKKG